MLHACVRARLKWGPDPQGFGFEMGRNTRTPKMGGVCKRRSSRPPVMGPTASPRVCMTKADIYEKDAPLKSSHPIRTAASAVDPTTQLLLP
jgi:hypothetical protein